jgi:hypothetical protein
VPSGNVIYDAGKTVYHAVKGEWKEAKSAVKDLGADGLAMFIPFVPAGATKLYKAADKVADGVKAADKAADGTKAVEKGVDAARHNANVRITDPSGKTVKVERLKSGGMTPEQKKLGFPKAQNATHTEAKAVTNPKNIELLKKGKNMTITGQKGPCPSCKGYMNKAAKKTGSKIEYQWRANGKTQNWKAKN